MAKSLGASKVKISQNFVAFSEYMNFNCNHEEREKRDLVFSVFFAVAISSPFEAAVVARMACSPLFWAGGCGRILITLVRPEPAEKSTLKGHGKRLLALVAPVD